MANSKNELMAAAAAKHAEAKKLMFEAGTELSPEQEKSVQALLGEYDALVAKAKLAERIESGENFLSTPEQPSVSSMTWRQSSADEGNFPIDAKSWRSMKVQTVSGERELRYHIPLAVQKKGYDAAFEAYIRQGKEKLGSNDRKTLTEGVDTAGGLTQSAGWV